VRFKERYVVTCLHVTVAHPAWVCGCGAETYVRSILPIRRHRAPVERRLAARVGLSREDAFAVRHALDYLREQTPRRSPMVRNVVRQTLAPLQRGPLSIVVADDNGDLLGATDAVGRLTGYSKYELADMHIWDLSVSRNVAQARRMWRHFLRGTGFVGAYHLQRKTGEPITTLCIAVAHIIPGLHVAIIRPNKAAPAPSEETADTGRDVPEQNGRSVFQDLE
jgi:PAS domain S-box-containing protein